MHEMTRVDNMSKVGTYILFFRLNMIFRGSYMSAHVLLILLNKLGKCLGKPRILSVFRNELNKFNNTGAQMLDSIYHMILR